MPSPSYRDLTTGDVVWILEPTIRRVFYLARVVKLTFGSDSIVRSAEVRTGYGTLNCPSVKIAPVLHVSDSD